MLSSTKKLQANEKDIKERFKELKMKTLDCFAEKVDK